MTIKKRLAVSNLLMLLIPAMLILLIVGATAGILMLYYHGEIGELGENQESVALARELVGHYLQEQTEDPNPEELSELMDIMDGIEFHIQLVQNGVIVESNLSQEDYDAIQWASGIFPDTGEPLILAAGKIALVRDSAVIDGSHATLIAVNSSVEETGSLGLLLRQVFQRYFILALGVFLLVISLSNALLSSRVARSVLAPLSRLGEGARRIRDGELNFSLDYDGDDEFGEVFRDFDAMRARLEESVQKQLRYEEERREFIAEMSHDLRTPLTAIRGYVEGLRDGVAAEPEKQARYLEIIHRKVCSMDALVDRLFLLSKLETGHFPFRFEQVELAPFLNQYVRSARDEFGAKGQSLSFENRASSPLCSLLDPEQMRCVLGNLLENSVKYRIGPAGSSRITLWEEQGKAVITVSDDGPGVAQSDISRLFESFYRGDKARSNPGDGSGLGLAIARRIIEAHHGKISAENRNGLTVRIELQQEDRDEANSDSGR